MNKLLFFAHLRDIVGQEELEWNGVGKTVASLKEELEEKFHFSNFETVMTAINEEFATQDTVINEGDIVAFIPPVSGG